MVARKIIPTPHHRTKRWIVCPPPSEHQQPTNVITARNLESDMWWNAPHQGQHHVRAGPNDSQISTCEALLFRGLRQSFRQGGIEDHLLNLLWLPLGNFKANSTFAHAESRSIRSKITFWLCTN
jgi:hypothetical protein